MSPTPDNIIESLQDGMDRIATIKRVDSGWRVVTHFMYPSNGLVEVTVRGGSTTVSVSDDGGALGEALSAGIPLKNYDKALAHLVRDQGLLLKNGAISTPPLPIEAAPTGVLLVANAAREIGRCLYHHARIPRDRDSKLCCPIFFLVALMSAWRTAR